MAFDLKKSGPGVLAALFISFGPAVFAQLLPEDMLEENEDVEHIRYYSVELIVFEYASHVSAGNEVFAPVQNEDAVDPLAGLDDPVFGDFVSNSSDESDADAFSDFAEPLEEEVTELDLLPSLTDVGFRLLTAEEMSMGEIHEKLETLDAYQPVLWSGWIQATRDRELSPLVRLRTLGVPPIHIDGTLQLYLKNYLHLVVDLTKEQQIATVQPVYRFERPSRDDGRTYNTDEYSFADRQTINYQIQEDRLFQSGQLRYYDHPKFGVLARVNRVEKAEPESDAEEDEAQGPAMLSNNE